MKTRKQKTAVKKRSRRPPAAPRQRGARAVAPAPALSLADCTVAEADSLKAALLRRLAEPRAVTLEIGSLKRIDTAGLQLLAAFVRERRTAGHPVEWRGRAPALEAAAGLLGLRSMLGLPAEDGR